MTSLGEDAMDGLNDTQRYFVEEHIEDFRDGLIARRELIRRVAIVVGSAAAATTLLAGCDLSPRSTGTPTPTVTSSSSPGLVAQPFATPPPAPTTDGITVMENDPRIAVSKPEIKGADGASLMAYLAKPIVSGRVPGVMVIHENRGQTEHIRDVVRRAALQLSGDRHQDKGGDAGCVRGAGHPNHRERAADGRPAEKGRRAEPDLGLPRRQPCLPQRHRRPLRTRGSAESVGRDDRVV